MIPNLNLMNTKKTSLTKVVFIVRKKSTDLIIVFSLAVDLQQAHMKDSLVRYGRKIRG